MHAGRDPSCGQRAAHRRSLPVPPRPGPGPTRPGPARGAARGGGGAGRGDSAGGAERGARAGAAAAATCAAANKVGWDRARRDARCSRVAARRREGCCPRNHETYLLAPCTTSHKALPHSGPQFPQRDSGAAAPSTGDLQQRPGLGSRGSGLVRTARASCSGERPALGAAASPDRPQCGPGAPWTRVVIVPVLAGLSARLQLPVRACRGDLGAPVGRAVCHPAQPHAWSWRRSPALAVARSQGQEPSSVYQSGGLTLPQRVLRKSRKAVSPGVGGQSTYLPVQWL